jgi:tRNA A-37 threonylcarbamoyl transferase component Bud32
MINIIVIAEQQFNFIQKSRIHKKYRSACVHRRRRNAAARTRQEMGTIGKYLAADFYSNPESHRIRYHHRPSKFP